MQRLARGGDVTPEGLFERKLPEQQRGAFPLEQQREFVVPSEQQSKFTPEQKLVLEYEPEEREVEPLHLKP